MSSKIILLEDISISTKKGEFYGLAGEVVTVTHDLGTMLLVVGKSGSFPVRRDRTSMDDPFAEVKEKPVTKVVKEKPKRPSYGAPTAGRKRK